MLYRSLLKPETLTTLDLLHTENARHGETVPDDDMDVLAGLIVASKSKRILQFGTFLGGSALVLADLARLSGNEARVVTVDPDPAMNECCRRYAEQARLSDVIETIDGNSLDPKLIARLGEQEWHAIFLDTTHQYGQTQAEIKAITPLCGPNTLFLFHDASAFAAETLDLGHQGGVRRAIREFCLQHPRWQWFVFEQPAWGQYGIGVMQKRTIL